MKQLRVVRSVHLAHAAGANERLDLVGPEGPRPDSNIRTGRHTKSHERQRFDTATTIYSVRNAIVGSILSARRVGTTQPSMQTPSMTIP